jgi:hypothetical protein
MLLNDKPEPPNGFCLGTDVSTKLVSTATSDGKPKAELTLLTTPEAISSGVINTVPNVNNKNNPRINIVARVSNTGFLNLEIACPANGIGIIKFTTAITTASVINSNGS